MRAGRPDLGVAVTEHEVQVAADTIQGALQLALGGRLDIPDVVSAVMVAETHAPREAG